MKLLGVTKKRIKTFLTIVFASMLYAFSTCFFVFPCGLILGGTGGISVILSLFTHYGAAPIIVIINILLIFAAFFTLGKGLAFKNFLGCFFTTFFIGVFDNFAPRQITAENPLIYALAAGGGIAFASAILFYIDSSSGGTDIIALIIKKYLKKINIGKALLLTDFLIVIIGAFLLNIKTAVCSVLALLIKTLGIDFLISLAKKHKK